MTINKNKIEMAEVSAPATLDKAWLDSSVNPDTRANWLLSSMTHEEKLQMIHGSCVGCPFVGHIEGIDRLGIPSLNMHDGPQGFRTEHATSTSFPGGMAMAATFDEDAVHEWGRAMGKEFRMKGANVQLGPGFNVARLPHNGRNFEYTVGEDPYLGYRLAKPSVQGIQEQQVIACAKHWVANSNEDHRMDGSEDVDERTLFEMYYPPFEGAVEAGVGSVMCSYQKINGVFSCENDETLNGHLKNDLGFKGFVMSDWGATHSASFHQGLDMEMPVGIMTGTHRSSISGEDLDVAVHRILRTMFEIGTFDQPPGTWDKDKFSINVTSSASASLARRLGSMSTVLLKNDDNVLPMQTGSKIALIGFAGSNAYEFSFGRGSGEVIPSYFVSPLEGIRAAAGPGSEIVFDTGDNLTQAAALAKDADYAVVFLGAIATEGEDRQSLSLDDGCKVRSFGRDIRCGESSEHQNEMVQLIANANPNTIAVLSVPGAIVMKWSPRVPAILTNFMPGQQVGNAIADILFGNENPVARLPITMPNDDNDLSMTPMQLGQRDANGQIHSTYSEKLLVGYRWYEEHAISFTTGFPFGHGLSYTSFEYSNLEVSQASPLQVNVSFTVANIGKRSGAEVAQLYLTFPAHAGEPRLQLKGFKKTESLAPGESKVLVLPLTPRELSIWSIDEHKWVSVSGAFTVHVGASSRDLRLTSSFEYK